MLAEQTFGRCCRRLSVMQVDFGGASRRGCCISAWLLHLRVAAASPRWKSGSTSICFVLMLGIASHQSVVVSDVVLYDCRFACCDLEAERRTVQGDKNDCGRGTIMLAMLKLLLIVEPAND